MDFGLLYFLTECIGVHYLLSTTIAYAVGLIITYLLSIYWIFDKRSTRNWVVELAIFTLIGVIGLGLTSLFMWLLTEKFYVHYLLSKIVTTGIVFIWNFIAKKLILFPNSHLVSSSIEHFPKQTQEELNTLLKLVKHYVPRCQMIVLYGSYARGGYVLWDEKVEFGIRTSYQSDYDILVIISKSNIKFTEDNLRNKVVPKYHKAFAHRRHASPQFIVEYVNTLNNELERSQYFFTEIIKEGIKIYDNKIFKLAKPRELLFREIKEFATKEFGRVYPNGCNLLQNCYFSFEREMYTECAFITHQVCERFYNAIGLVFTNYRPKNHKLDELGAMVKGYSRDLASVFPQNNDFEKRCFDLLCRAYIEARYNKDFAVTKEELIYLLERVEILKEITLRICTNKIASYDALIKTTK